MKTAFFDCSNGISGDMTLGALIDAGMSLTYLKKEINKLRISGIGYRISKKNHAAHIEVITKAIEKHRGLKDILSIISKSGLSRNVKALSSRIFTRLAEAESKVHRLPVNSIHFHEVGAVDAIVDIAGCAIGLEYFGVTEVYSSPVNVGSGKIKHAHGILPIPAPAAAELLKGIPMYDSGIKKELATPTGAAIISTIAKSFGPMPRLKVEQIGSGAGSYSSKDQPGFLRIFIGEKELETEKDVVLMIETNLDDMYPKLYDKTIAALMKAGALDAHIEPIRMKKQRSAIKLSVLCPIELKDQILKIVFRQTTSFGARTYLVGREKLKRHFKKVKTRYGGVRVKIGTLSEKIMTLAPEYEDYKKIALKHRLPRPSPNFFIKAFK